MAPSYEKGLLSNGNSSEHFAIFTVPSAETNSIHPSSANRISKETIVEQELLRYTIRNKLSDKHSSLKTFL